jgi:hypothetical protein
MLQTCVLGSLKILASGGVILASIESVCLQLWSFFFDESKLVRFFGQNKTDSFLGFSGLFVILASIVEFLIWLVKKDRFRFKIFILVFKISFIILYYPVFIRFQNSMMRMKQST